MPYACVGMPHTGGPMTNKASNDALNPLPLQGTIKLVSRAKTNWRHVAVCVVPAIFVTMASVILTIELVYTRCYKMLRTTLI